LLITAFYKRFSVKDLQKIYFMKKKTLFTRIGIAAIAMLFSQYCYAQPTNYGTGSGTGGTNSNSYFGNQAGSTNTANENTFIGALSGMNSNAQGNTCVGFGSGINNTGTYNTLLGNGAGSQNQGNENSFVGTGSGTLNRGSENSFMGVWSGMQNTTGNRNTSIGVYSGAINTTGSGNSTLGWGARTNNNISYGTAVGYEAQVYGGDGVAVGINATSNGQSGTAVGPNSSASADATGVGSGCSASAQNATAIGTSSSASNVDATAIGSNSTSSAQNATAIGTGSTASNNSATAIGSSSNAINNNATAIGTSASATNFATTAIGYSSNALGNSSTAIGPNALANGSFSFAMGNAANTMGTANIAMGNGAATSANNATAIGTNAGAHAQNSTAIGTNAVVVGVGSTTIGDNSTTNEANRIILGDATDAIEAVGIGTATVPFAKLHVEAWGVSEQAKTALYTNYNDKTSWSYANFFNIHDDWVKAFAVVNSSGPGFDRFSVLGNGDVWSATGVYGSSDRRLKKDLLQIDRPLEKLSQLTGYEYYWNETAQTKVGLSNEKQIGLIAQDVEKVIPQAVKVFNKEGYKAIDYTRIIPLLVEAVKAENQKVDVLEKQISSKDAKIAELESRFDNLLATVNELKQSVSICCTQATHSDDIKADNPTLDQNIPNPLDNYTTIGYYLPQSAQAAILQVVNMEGKVMFSENISQKGRGKAEINTSTWASGMYSYQLTVDGNKVDAKKMIIAH
jgi:hypothetical protein